MAEVAHRRVVSDDERERQAAEREAKLAKALRDNLRRRKAQDARPGDAAPRAPAGGFGKGEQS